MRYRKIGFYIISVSPLLSLLLVRIAFTGFINYIISTIGSHGASSYSWLVPIVGMTLVHISIIAIQILGIVIYLAGYKAERQKLQRSLFTKLVVAFLIIWGILLSYFLYLFYYNEVILWSMEPDVRELVIWDHLEFATWILKGILWTVAGFIILATSKPKQL